MGRMKGCYLSSEKGPDWRTEGKHTQEKPKGRVTFHTRVEAVFFPPLDKNTIGVDW